ncbi:MAG: hypothetical protein WGN25_08175 [Candidatus Electrothrix sp. GW3-4]|uniref:golvesin C-terminal-like domain-containing protein n=1 Tax=Candidatus Electrothrix sp. GW3-4 TaxID=3126740 RepID=UPI0030D39048
MRYSQTNIGGNHQIRKFVVSPKSILNYAKFCVDYGVHFTPLALVRSYQNPYQLTIIVEDSVTYPGIGDNGEIKGNKVVDPDNETVVIKERFFKAHNLEEWFYKAYDEKLGMKAPAAGLAESRGFGGNYHYAKTVLKTQVPSAGKWFFDIPEGGYYSVYVSIPAENATTKNAKYQISHNGRIDYKTVNQAEIEGPLENRWVRLGTYDFAEGNNHYVKLANNTGEVGKYIAFDAIKFVKVYSNLPVVYSVSPATAIKDEDKKTIFTVTGQNLDLVELEFSLANCEGITEVTSGSSTLKEFQCKPTSTGQHSGTIKAGGSILKEFSVKVTDPPVPTLQKITVHPKNEEDGILYEGGQAYYEAVGTFSDGTESVITDQCTWWASQYATSLGNGLVEALLESADNEVRITAVYSDDTISISGTYETVVTKRPIIVRSISPTSVTLGVTTDFTITGENLPVEKSISLRLEGCDEERMEPLDSARSTYIQFRCTPRSDVNPGMKTGELTYRPYGDLETLATFSIEFLEAPTPPDDEQLVLKEVRVKANEDLYAGKTATYQAKAYFSNNVGNGDSLKVPGEKVLKIVEITGECAWQAYGTNYVTSLGGGLVQRGANNPMLLTATH